jgi:hypothetical protein
MKKIFLAVFITFLASCEKNNDYLITFTIKNSSSNVYNGKIEPILYLSQKPIFEKKISNLKAGEELVLNFDPKEIKSLEGSYYITLTDPRGKILMKEFGGFDGYDLYQGKYNIVASDSEIIIK